MFILTVRILKYIQTLPSRARLDGVCNDCVLSGLPFYGLRNLNFVDSLDDDIKLNSDEIQVDEHLYALNARRGQ